MLVLFQTLMCPTLATVKNEKILCTKKYIYKICTYYTLYRLKASLWLNYEISKLNLFIHPTFVHMVSQLFI